MADTTETWTKEDLKTYLLIYCANADFLEAKVEVDFIKSKANSSNFDLLHATFEKDNDFQSLQKIQKAVANLQYEKEELEDLLQESKALFMCDNHYNTLEKNLFRGLRQLLQV